MRPRSNFRLAILSAALIGGFLLTGAQELPWTYTDPEVALNQLLGSTPLGWRILTEWKSEKETIQIVPGSEVICVGSDKVLFRGKHLWRGTYDEATGKLDVTRNLSAEERKQLEIEHEVPDWARRLVAKEPVREEMVLTVKGEADGSLSMTGDIYGEKIHWDEPENVDTGQPDPGKRTAEIMADSDKRRPLGFTFTTPGLSQDARDALKQALYLSQLFRQREELLHSQIPAQIASLQKTYDALNTSSAGANEVRRLEEIGRTIDALHADWLSNLEKNKQKILETASQNPSHFNSGLRNILEKYVQVLKETKQDPNNTLNRKILEDTEVRLLLYLGEGAEAVNWHDDLQKRAFLYAMIKAEADFAYPTAVTEASLVINAACVNAPRRAPGGRDSLAGTKTRQQTQNANLDEALTNLRSKTGKPKVTNGRVTGGTVAVSKSNVKGIDSKIYEGKSGSLYDEWPWEKDAKYQSTHPITEHHAEEDIANQWERDLSNAFPGGSRNVEGEIELHIDQPMCSDCRAGLKNGESFPGVIGQFSQNHPDIEIHITNSWNGEEVSVKAGVQIDRIVHR